MPSSGSHTAAKVNADFGETTGDHRMPLVSTEVLVLPKSSEIDNYGPDNEESETDCRRT